MDYKLKYLKYKEKYLELKGAVQIGGVSKLNSAGNSVKHTKAEYDVLPEAERKEFPFYCGDANPHLCTIHSDNYGLCKKNPGDCDVYTGEHTYGIYDNVNGDKDDLLANGRTSGYDLYEYGKDGSKDCSKLTVNNERDYGLGDNIPQKFKIMSYNCWWSVKTTGKPDVDKFHLDFFDTRIRDIARIIMESDADVVCLQECGQRTFDILNSVLSAKYPNYYENPLSFQENNNAPRFRSIETVCFSKYKVKSFKLLGVGGNLSYSNSMLMLEFNNLVVFDCYLQAGGKNSPGQRDLWYNYSRCRYNEYLSIGKFMRDNHIEKPIVVLGDFNTNLSSPEEAPELRAFGSLGLEDAWLSKYPNTVTHPGYTEDTTVNLMRWNVKFEEKQKRIDGIFHTKDKIKTNEVVVLGTNPIAGVNVELLEQFKNIRVYGKPSAERDAKIRLTDGHTKFWPSDHFAVVADLEFTGSAPGSSAASSGPVSNSVSPPKSEQSGCVIC
jgi:endonuclease/exonuclease/phosphatase family metal-dependent hydrolase